MFDISKITISPRARLKGVVLPLRPSRELAYFCGLMAGDGHIRVQEDKNTHYLQCQGNPKDEKELYHLIICPLIKKLFNVGVEAKQIQDTYGIRICSNALVQYLIEVLGLPANRKYSQLKIPMWAKKDKELVVNYIRGLADTDFCLSLKKRYRMEPYYPVITGVSESRSFIEEIAKELESFGLRVSRHYDVLINDARFPKRHSVTHRIHLYGHTQLVKWMRMIGFSSPKHLKRFNLWQERNAHSNRIKVISAIKVSKELSLTHNQAQV